MERAEVEAILTSMPGAAPRRWFGTQGYNVAGKMFATWWQDAIVLRLPEEPRGRALQGAGARLWNPRGYGKPMGDWVVIAEPDDGFVDLAEEAYAYGLAKSREPSRKRKRSKHGRNRI